MAGVKTGHCGFAENHKPVPPLDSWRRSRVRIGPRTCLRFARVGERGNRVSSRVNEKFSPYSRESGFGIAHDGRRWVRSFSPTQNSSALLDVRKIFGSVDVFGVDITPFLGIKPDWTLISARRVDASRNRRELVNAVSNIYALCMSSAHCLNV